MKTYEAMFLLDAGDSDFESVSAPVREVLDRAGAEVLAIKPWDDRRLAYEIKGRKRGLYVLTYFKADPSSIDEMQHDIQLNDRLLRAIILSADHVSDEQISADTPATLAETSRVAAEAQRAAKKEAEAIAQAAKEAAADEALPSTETETPDEQNDQLDEDVDKTNSDNQT